MKVRIYYYGLEQQKKELKEILIRTNEDAAKDVAFIER